MDVPTPVPWGKLAGYEEPLPLASHLLDTAACAGALWDGWLRPGLRSLLAEAIADGDESAARARLRLLAGVHDVGKATPIFQGQLLSTAASHEARERFAGIAASFEASGFSCSLTPMVASLAQRPRDRRSQDRDCQENGV